MTEEIEGATEALQKEATEAPTKTLQKGASRKEYMCSVCGATVAPIEYETERGIRYKCPKCTRFMRPLTLEDVREKEEGEVPLEGPKEVARRMLRGGKYTAEEIMSETGLTKHVVGGLKGALAKKGVLPLQRERRKRGGGAILRTRAALFLLANYGTFSKSLRPSISLYGAVQALYSLDNL